MPTSELWLVYEARLLFKARLLLVQSSQTPGLYITQNYLGTFKMLDCSCHLGTTARFAKGSHSMFSDLETDPETHRFLDCA